MPPSLARLGSARIQLELEAFQLGSARLMQILAQLVRKKISWNQLLLDFESLVEFFKKKINFHISNKSSKSSDFHLIK